MAHLAELLEVDLVDLVDMLMCCPPLPDWTECVHSALETGQESGVKCRQTPASHTVNVITHHRVSSQQNIELLLVRAKYHSQADRVLLGKYRQTDGAITALHW